MATWRLTTWLLVSWTLAMAVWLVFYTETDVTCGPEIYRNCQIGAPVTTGLGRPGIVMLWALGAGVLGVSWLTTRRRRSAPRERSVAADQTAPAPLRPVARVAAVAFPVAIVAGFMTATRTQAPTAAEGVQVQVLSAVLYPATPNANFPQRARVSLNVLVTNPSGRQFDFDRAALRSGGEALAYDSARFRLLPRETGVNVQGSLHFQPRERLAERLERTRRTRLVIGGRSIPVTLRIGRR